jgi:hypothetical protein
MDTYVAKMVDDAATYTVSTRDSGRLHIMPDLTADCAITLPSPAAGLVFEFVYGGNAIDAQDWNFTTGSDTNYIMGGVLHVDDAPAANSIIGDGNSNSKFNVLVPEGGTAVKFYSDGTLWYISGVVVAASAPTFADQ